MTSVHSLLKKIIIAGILLILHVPVFSQTPDFSGIWFPSRFDANAPRLQPGSDALPFNESAQKMYDEYIAEFDTTDDPGGFCIKPGLPRSVWGAPFPVEMVQTEGFINVLWEGYYQYRKIYLEGHPRPDPILPTRMGYSVGHFEGETLVIETDFLREYPYMRRIPNSDSATIVERWNLVTSTDENGEEQKYLTNEMTLTDPKLYTEPVTINGVLAWSPDTPILEYSCSETIYDQHLQDNGLTPPDFSQLQ